MWNKIKLDPADKVFSDFIRTRDGWKCQRCGTPYTPPTKALQCSHYFGRGAENTRFDPENCDALCTYCHSYWGSTDKEGYRNFKIKQLGQAGFDRLMIRSNTYKKRDRKMSLLVVREMLREIKK